ncbi:MAG: hypothetical protein AAGH15_01145 [Myxococcota bacterium]
MIYRTQILVCQPGKRDTLLGALTQGAAAGIPGMTAQKMLADAHDADTIVLLQSWESKEAADTFQASIPAEKAAMFQSLMASRTMCWHAEPLHLG